MRDDCKYAEFDRYFSEYFCRKKATPCRLVCRYCAGENDKTNAAG